MKNLKKFQEFALSKEEQKSLTGGKLAAWTCYLFTDGGGVVAGAGFDTINGALNYCSVRPSCAGCF